MGRCEPHICGWKLTWSQLKWLYSKGLAKGSRIPTVRVCEDTDSWNPSPSQVQVRDTYQWVGRWVNGLKSPPRNWNPLAGKKGKGQRWTLPNQRAMMAAHKYKRAAALLCPHLSSLHPPEPWNGQKQCKLTIVKR